MSTHYVGSFTACFLLHLLFRDASNSIGATQNGTGIRSDRCIPGGPCRWNRPTNRRSAPPASALRPASRSPDRRTPGASGARRPRSALCDWKKTPRRPRMGKSYRDILSGDLLFNLFGGLYIYTHKYIIELHGT